MAVWLIVGGDPGIHRSLAEAIIGAGHRLVACVSDPAPLCDLEQRHPTQIRVVAIDVNGAAIATNAIRYAAEAFGRVDVIVNSPMPGRSGPVEETPLAYFQSTIDTNLIGTIALAQAALPLLRAHGSGRFLQIAPVAGGLTEPDRAARVAAVRGIEGFLDVLAGEVSPMGIKVTFVELGRVDHHRAGTPTNSAFHDGAAQAIDRRKAAAIILRLASLPDPPVRLLLGGSAIRAVARATLARIESDQKWRQLSLAADVQVRSTIGTTVAPADLDAYPLKHTLLGRLCPTQGVPA